MTLSCRSPGQASTLLAPNKPAAVLHNFTVLLLMMLSLDPCFGCCYCVIQVAKFIPRGVILQYLGAQREIFIESPAAAALSQYMPSPKASESSRIVKSPMTGHLVQVKPMREAYACS